MKTQTAEETARLVVRNIILRHGAPKYILTDRGTNFTSRLFKAMCHFLHVKKIQTTAYHPQSNGMVERLHRTLVDSLSHYVRRDGRDWDEWIPYSLMAYRSTVHSSLGFTPHFLLYGRQLDLPFDCPHFPEERSERYEDYIISLQNKLKTAHEIARGTETLARETWTRKYNQGKQSRDYEIGDKVYLLEPAAPPHHAKKFYRPWTGPHIVRARLSSTTYELALCTGERYVVHVNRLKPAAVQEDQIPGPASNHVGHDNNNAIEMRGERVSPRDMEANRAVPETTPLPLIDTEGQENEVLEGRFGTERTFPDELVEEQSTHTGDPTWYPERVQLNEEEQRRSPYDLRGRTNQALEEEPIPSPGIGVNVRPRRRLGGNEGMVESD